MHNLFKTILLLSVILFTCLAYAGIDDQIAQNQTEITKNPLQINEGYIKA